METKKAEIILLVANGQPPASGHLQQLARQSNLVIAVDGGSTICYRNQIKPDYIVGDLDSIRPELGEYLDKSRFIHQPDQNLHDLEKAITFACSFKPHILKITAVFGKRADQTLANLVTMQQKFKDVPLEFYDDFGCLQVISADSDLDLPIGQIISLFSFLPVSGITLHGFKYPLQDIDYPNGFNGLSNVITRRPARIEIKQGFLFFYTLLTHD